MKQKININFALGIKACDTILNLSPHLARILNNIGIEICSHTWLSGGAMFEDAVSC
jgi:hypothetical protein